MGEHFLGMKNSSKLFLSVKTAENVCLPLHPVPVHAEAGENEAGKAAQIASREPAAAFSTADDNAVLQLEHLRALYRSLRQVSFGQPTRCG